MTCFWIYLFMTQKIKIENSNVTKLENEKKKRTKLLTKKEKSVEIATGEPDWWWLVALYCFLNAILVPSVRFHADLFSNHGTSIAKSTINRSTTRKKLII